MTDLTSQNQTGVNPEGEHSNRPLKFLTASSIIGDTVHNLHEEHMGAIEDTMIDITKGEIEYYIIKFGGFLTINEKYFAIPFKLLTVEPGKKMFEYEHFFVIPFKLLTVEPGKKMFILDQSRETLEKAPGFDMAHWPETNFHAEETYWSFID